MKKPRGVKASGLFLFLAILDAEVVNLLPPSKPPPLPCEALLGGALKAVALVSPPTNEAGAWIFILHELTSPLVVLIVDVHREPDTHPAHETEQDEAQSPPRVDC
jgi:hypothetical protein